MKIKKGDLVSVVSGDEKGKSGRVLHVLPGDNRLIVERVNMVKRHMRPTTDFPQGGIQEKEASIHISNVMLVCPRCGQAARAGSRMAEKTKVRFCRKCNEVVDEARRA